MSLKMTRQVWRSSLPPQLKLVALYIANLADDRGNKIYPSVARIAERVGKSSRVVRRVLSELRELEIIQPVANQKGGKRVHTVYWMDVSKLPFPAGYSLQVPAGGVSQTMTPTSPFSVQTMTPASPFGNETMTPTSPFLDKNDNLTPTPRGGCGESRSSHPLGVYYPLEVLHGQKPPAPPPSDGEDQNLSPEMSVQYWLKKTWSDRNSELHVRHKFPTAKTGDLIAAERAMGVEEFRKAWLEFLATGSERVYIFLKAIRLNGWRAPRPDFNVERAPTQQHGASLSRHQRPRRKTQEEITEAAIRRARNGY